MKLIQSNFKFSFLLFFWINIINDIIIPLTVTSIANDSLDGVSKGIDRVSLGVSPLRVYLPNAIENNNMMRSFQVDSYHRATKVNSVMPCFTPLVGQYLVSSVCNGNESTIIGDCDNKIGVSYYYTTAGGDKNDGCEYNQCPSFSDLNYYKELNINIESCIKMNNRTIINCDPLSWSSLRYNNKTTPICTQSDFKGCNLIKNGRLVVPSSISKTSSIVSNAFVDCDDIEILTFEIAYSNPLVEYGNSFFDTTIQNIYIPLKELHVYLFKGQDGQDNHPYLNLTTTSNTTVPNQAINVYVGYAFMDLAREEGISNSFFEEFIIGRNYNLLEVSCNGVNKTDGTIIISASVLEIDDEAFADCDTLKYLYFEENSLLQSIGTEAFSSGLENFMNTTITIPKSVTSIGTMAFFGIDILEKIQFESGSPFEFELSCEDVDINGIIVIPNHIEIIHPYAFYGCKELKKVVMHDKIISIGNSSFSNSGLIEIDIPSSVIKIGDEAFGSCSSLQEVFISPNSNLKEIGVYSFVYAVQLTHMYIPKTVHAIGLGAFAFCSNLRSFIFDYHIKFKVIEIGLLYNATSLERIEIPNSVTRIKEIAFAYSNLQEILFHANSNISLIEGGAFSYSNIEEIRFPLNFPKSIEPTAFRQSNIRKVYCLNNSSCWCNTHDISTECVYESDDSSSSNGDGSSASDSGTSDSSSSNGDESSASDSGTSYSGSTSYDDGSTSYDYGSTSYDDNSSASDSGTSYSGRRLNANGESNEQSEGDDESYYDYGSSCNGTNFYCGIVEEVVVVNDCLPLDNHRYYVYALDCNTTEICSVPTAGYYIKEECTNTSDTTIENCVTKPYTNDYVWSSSGKDPFTCSYVHNNPTLQPTKMGDTSPPTISSITQWRHTIMNEITAMKDDFRIDENVTIIENYYHLNVNGEEDGSCIEWIDYWNPAGNLAQYIELKSPRQLYLGNLHNYNNAFESFTCDNITAVSTILNNLKKQKVGTNVIMCNDNYWRSEYCSGSSPSVALCAGTREEDCSKEIDICNKKLSQNNNNNNDNIRYVWFSPCLDHLHEQNETQNSFYSGKASLFGIAFADGDAEVQITSDMMQYRRENFNTMVEHSIKITFDNDDAQGGLVYCGAFNEQNQPQSVQEVRIQGKLSFLSSRNVLVDLGDLHPLSNYTVYCYGVSSGGLSMTYDKMTATRTSIYTGGSRQLKVNLATSIFTIGKNIRNVLRLALDVPFKEKLTIKIGLINVNTSGNNNNELFMPWSPRTIEFSSSSSKLWRKLSFNGKVQLEAGWYRLNITTSKDSHLGKDFVIMGTNHTIQVITDQHMPPPSSIKAIFHNSGGSVVITTNIPSNRIGMVGVFKCSEVLDFVGASASSCSWIDDSRLRIFPQSNSQGHTLSIGDSITITGYANLKHSCSNYDIDTCSNWEAATQPLIAIANKPLQPVKPIVSIVASTTVNPAACAPLIIDMSASTGSGGRSWNTSSSSISVSTVDSNTPPQNITNFLNQQDPNADIIEIPYDVFEYDQSYSFIIKKCNFLDSCSVGFHKVVVLDTMWLGAPSVKVFGSSERSIRRNKPLLLRAFASVFDCDARNDNMRGITLKWSIKKHQDASTYENFESISKDPAIFKLPPCTLEHNTFYLITVTASSDKSPYPDSMRVRVYVEQGPVKATIATGLSASVVLDRNLTIDASTSVDTNMIGKQGSDADLLFFWTCEQIYSAQDGYVAKPCTNMSYSSSWSNSESFTMASSVDGRILLFTVVVSHEDGRSDVAEIEVEIIPPNSPVISLPHLRQFDYFNPLDRLIITSTVTINQDFDYSWTSSPDVPISSITTSSSNRILLPGSGGGSMEKNMFFVIKPQSLQVLTEYNFAINVNYLNGNSIQSSISVTTNSPPFPGKFTVSPSSGKELMDEFMISAINWEDDDLPLSYVFGVVSDAGSNVVLQSKSEESRGRLYLNANDDGSDVSVFSEIYDNLGLNISAYDSVVVNPYIDGQSTTNKNASAHMNLLESISSPVVNNNNTETITSMEASKYRSLIGIAMVGLNKVDCLLPSNIVSCASLNRTKCASTPMTCGSCMDGYIGEFGDANTACYIKNESNLMLQQERRCPGDCSNNKGNGYCEFRSKINNELLSSCVIGVSCVAKCKCKAGFSGIACHLDSTLAERRSKLRLDLFESSRNIDNQFADSTVDELMRQVLLLQSFLTRPDEVPSEVMNDLLQIVKGYIEQYSMYHSILHSVYYSI